MSDAISGGCHCGAVRFEAKGDAGFAGHCQCTDCRKFSGSAHMSFMLMPAERFTVTGKVSAYDHAGGSGAVITHHFCPACGAGLFSKNARAAGMVFLYASALDDPERFRPTHAIYTSSGPSWDHLDPTLIVKEAG